MLNRRRGFTLIELLVVVAIIALLIAILLPSLGKAKANAVRVKCAAVLRQWGSVVMLYSSEYDQFFGIKSGSQWNNGLYDTEWNVSGNTTVGNKYSVALRNCPGDPTFGQPLQNGVATPPVRPTLYWSVRYLPVASNKTMWRLNEISHPSTAMFLCDASTSNTGSYQAGGVFNDYNGTAPNDLKPALTSRHGGKGNVLFLDSHVENGDVSWFQANITASGTYPPPAADAGKNWTLLLTP